MKFRHIKTYLSRKRISGIPINQVKMKEHMTGNLNDLILENTTDIFFSIIKILTKDIKTRTNNLLLCLSKEYFFIH